MLKIAAESGIGSTAEREFRSVDDGKRLSSVPSRELRSSVVELKVLKSVRGG